MMASLGTDGAAESARDVHQSGHAQLPGLYNCTGWASPEGKPSVAVPKEVN